MFSRTKGFVTYVCPEDLQLNRADSHPGWGSTEEESQQAALYWHNQLPWAVTVPASEAPDWCFEAIALADEDFEATHGGSSYWPPKPQP